MYHILYHPPWVHNPHPIQYSVHTLHTYPLEYIFLSISDTLYRSPNIHTHRFPWRTSVCGGSWAPGPLSSTGTRYRCYSTSPRDPARCRKSRVQSALITMPQVGAKYTDYWIRSHWPLLGANGMSTECTTLCVCLSICMQVRAEGMEGVDES